MARRPTLTPEDLALLREGAGGRYIRATVERRCVPDPAGQARKAHLDALSAAGLACLWHVRGRDDPNGDYIFSYILTEDGKRALG